MTCTSKTQNVNKVNSVQNDLYNTYIANYVGYLHSCTS